MYRIVSSTKLIIVIFLGQVKNALRMEDNVIQDSQCIHSYLKNENLLHITTIFMVLVMEYIQGFYVNRRLNPSRCSAMKAKPNRDDEGLREA